MLLIVVYEDKGTRITQEDSHDLLQQSKQQ